MNKSLKALENIFSFIMSECEEEYYEDDYELIKKHLKALEIIKTKSVDVFSLKGFKTFEDYNDDILAGYAYDKDACYQFLLTKEEFKLLKEVLL